MTEPRHALVELTLARMREFVREPAAIFWTFGFPVLLAVGLGIAFRHRPAEAHEIAVVGTGADADRVMAIAEAAPNVSAERLSAEEALERLERSKLPLIVEVRSTAEGPSLTYRFDADNDDGKTARMVVDGVIQRGLGRQDVASSEDDTSTQPGGRYIDFLIPGLIGLNLMSSSMWGIGYAIALARRRKLLRRLAATPMRRSHFLLSFMLARIVFLAAEVAVLLAVGWVLFDVAIRGSAVATAVLALVGAMSFMGVALLIASRTDNTEVASGIMNAVMLPMWLLSGAFFSYERFPEMVHPLIRLLPLTALNDALRAIMNEGAPLWTAWSEILVLCAIGLLSFLAALRVFRWH
ncbi:MAG: ABC transporter permease [Deltaproteobacteria bacterium]|jgi:ABC transporter DrrB family efflux protein|nr:ABC transporter permease [Deltaproteobacteria bacterium]MBW2533648.1 ABC transporter permease [Deltaproteobacteria bacterium]